MAQAMSGLVNGTVVAPATLVEVKHGLSLLAADAAAPGVLDKTHSTALLRGKCTAHSETAESLVQLPPQLLESYSLLENRLAEL